MSTDVPISKPNRPAANKVSWPVIFSVIQSPPQWFASVAATVISLIVVFLLFLAAVAIIRLASDLLGNDRQQASEAVKSLLPIVAAVIGLPLIIWRLVILNQQTQISEAKTQIDRETYYTSIFAKSVELMGSVRESKSVGVDGNELTRSVPNIESRLGGLYSLERLLVESFKDQKAILETLCAYIRENSPLEIPEGPAEAERFARKDIHPVPTRRADVQAALTIIGRRPEALRLRAESERWQLDLTNANLVAYDLSNLNYDYGCFSFTFFDRANMAGTSFANCAFEHNFMRGAEMKDAIFRSAYLEHCDLKDAVMEGTDFSCATLVDTDLRKARVLSFNIKGANLEMAFGSFLQYAIKDLKERGPDYVNSQEIVGIYQLFQKAVWDDATAVSDSVREAILIMRQSDTQRGERKPDGTEQA